MARAKMTTKKRSATAKAKGVKRAVKKTSAARKTAPKKKRTTAKTSAARKTAPKKKRTIAKTSAARKTVPKKKRTTAKVTPRRPRVGYLAFAAEHLVEPREAKEAQQPAFLHHARTPHDDFAEVLGEDTVETMTSGEYVAEDKRDQIVPEEHGGPFVETSGRQEFADGTDPSNPNTATREPFPRASRQQE